MNENWIKNLPPEVQAAVQKAREDSEAMYENLKSVRGEPYARVVQAGSKLTALVYMAVDLMPPEHRGALQMMGEMANDACIDMGLAVGLDHDDKDIARQRLVEFGKDVEAFTKLSFVRK